MTIDIPALRAICERLAPNSDETWVQAPNDLREQITAALDEVARLRVEVARLTVNADHSCTCPHQDAHEPLAMHDKACPIRVNKFRRIAPEVALDRIASALAETDGIEDATAEEIATWLDEWNPTCGEVARLVPDLQWFVRSENENTPLNAAPNLSFENVCILIMAGIRANLWRTDGGKP